MSTTTIATTAGSAPATPPSGTPVSSPAAQSSPTVESRPAEPAQASTPGGHVAFVGTGPGDPGLLTLRAAELIAAADVVVHDGGMWDVIRRHGAADVRVLGGEEPPADESADPSAAPIAPAPAASASAPSLAGLAADAAAEGHAVVRLFGGDPGLLSALVEEAAACAAAHIPFEIVPGVPAETAVPAYAGIPLTTERGTDVRIIAGASASAEIASAAEGTGTLVVLASIEELPRLATALVAAGRPGTTPVAVTQGGTTTAQETVTSTLERLPADLKGSRLTGPVVSVVGDVVPYRGEISWFETKPLFGWRVLVPRTREQAAALSVQLRDYGAVPHEVPTIAVEPPRTPQQMERAVKGLVTGRYEWIAFTSTNAVRAVREKFEEYGLDARAFAGIKVAAVGEQTAAALLAFGIKPDLLPSGEQSAAGLLADWPPYDKVFDPINRVFLPRADIATETLVAGLIDLGWEVDDVTAYRTVRAAPPPARTREAIKGGGFDAVLFTSSSTVRNLVGIAGKPHASTVIACIGPATAKTAEEHGLRVDVMSAEPSVAALAAALADFGAARRHAAEAAGEPVLRPSERRAGSRRRTHR